MSALPHGTVTFAFTDVEGSTALLKRLGDEYGDVLATHRRLVRESFGAHGGVEIDTQGDAFFFAFERARDAVAGATRLQRAHAAQAWPEGGTVRVRIGLHTGEPTVGEEGYLGLDVVRAARLCGTCPGGHVILSEATRALAGSSLPDGVSLFPLGERHLKDIDEPERVYELEIDGVPGSPTAPSPRPEPPVGPSSAGSPPAPPPPLPAAGPPGDDATSLDTDIERFAAEIVSRAGDRVRESLAQALAGLEGHRVRVEVTADEQRDLDELVADADGLAKRIGAELRRAFGDASRG